MPVPTDVALMSFFEKLDCENSSGQDDTALLQQFAGQKESMILVQVNPGETFTIQADNNTQRITGPAQVPMLSLNGLIPPIQVPQGYISQVIEDQNGIRKVIVIPETQLGGFRDGPVMQPMMSQPSHGIRFPIPLQQGTHCNYIQQMSTLSMNQQQYSAGDHLHLIHHQPNYTQAEGLAPADIDKHIPTIPQFYQYPQQTMDADFGRSGKVKERLQRKLHDRRQHLPETSKNPSPSSAHSFSPSSSSSYATSPSPNSSPDLSPIIVSGSVAACSDGYMTQANFHPYHQMSRLPSGQQEYQLSSPYSSNYHRGGGSGHSVRKSDAENSSRISASDGMSSGNSSGGSPRRGPSALRKQKHLSLDPRHYQQDSAQHDASFRSTDARVPFPTKDGKWNLEEYLSAIMKPEVYDISPRHASVKWSMQYSPPADSGMENQAIYFEVYLMQKGKDGNGFKLLRSDCNQCIEVKDLKPGVEYQTKVLAEFKSVKGGYSEITTFRTTTCQPDTPGAPKMINSTKNSISLKWMPPNDNGEKILKYHLEWDEGEKGSGFRSLFSGTQRQYRVPKLQPSRNYTFRLSCENAVGVSPWSPEVTHKTNGTAPSTPDPPRLGKASVRSLSLIWSCSATEIREASSAYLVHFTLEMDDGMGYGFRVVHDGVDVRAQIKNLNKSTLYKFRLRAYNNDGRSGYSATASFFTLPDKPNPPGKVSLKGRAHPTCFKVAWCPPEEDGGSDITKYVLECAQEKGKEMIPIYSGVDTEFLVENVQPGITCRLRVFCVTNGGTSMPSEVSLITSPPVVPGQCAPPRAASSASPTVVSLRWDPPNYDGGSGIMQYEVAMVGGDCLGEIASFKESLEKVYVGNLLGHSVGNLKPGTAYKFALRAANKVGMGQWSDVVELSTNPGPPEKPETPEPESVASDTVLLVWKKPHDNGSAITGYSVEWGSQESTMNLRRTSSALSSNFPHLTSNRIYFFRVQALNDIGNSPFSDVVSVKTAPSCPDRVTNISQGNILPIEKLMEELEMEDDDVNDAMFPRPATSAMVCWDRPPDNGVEITHYILEVTQIKSERSKQTGADGEAFLLEIEGEDCYYLVRDLQPDSEYKVRIKAINKIGSGSFSLPLIIETQPLPPDPPVLECTCLHNSLKLKWGDTDGNVTYRLQMKEKHGRYATIYNGLGRSFKVNRCTERTAYFFRISAKNDAGDGPFSGVQSFSTTTAPPQQLKNLPSVSVQGCCATISWDEVESIKGDTVSSILNVESCGSLAIKQAISLNQNFYRIDGLVPGRKYKVQVATVRLVSVPAVQRPDAPQQLEEENLADLPFESTAQEEEQLEDAQTEEIIGQFTNWVTFEIPHLGAMDDTGGLGAKGDEESALTSQTLTQAVNSTLARISDDTMGPVLLMISFFLLAVVVAFFVQFLVK